MTKSTVSKLFVGSLIAIIGGVLLAGFAVVAAFWNGAFVISGPDVVDVNATPFFWSMVALMIVGGLTLIGGAIGQFVAWLGALLNTARLEDKTWFILLLVLGLLSFGLIAMILYVLAGPDGMADTSREASRTPPAPVMPAPVA
jgi:hypothetical protein